jgi:hypothetical protein
MHLLTIWTPPCKPLSNLPLPRPPARTWALITRFGDGKLFATLYASSGVCAATLFGVGIPYWPITPFISISMAPLMRHICARSLASSWIGIHGWKESASALQISPVNGSEFRAQMIANALLTRATRFPLRRQEIMSRVSSKECLVSIIVHVAVTFFFDLTAER